MPSMPLSNVPINIKYVPLTGATTPLICADVTPAVSPSVAPFRRPIDRVALADLQRQCGGVDTHARQPRSGANGAFRSAHSIQKL